MVKYLSITAALFVGMLLSCFVGCDKEFVAPVETPPAAATNSEVSVPMADVRTFMQIPEYQEGTSNEFERGFGPDELCTKGFVDNFQATSKQRLSAESRKIVADEITPRLKQIAWEAYEVTGNVGSPAWLKEFIARTAVFGDEIQKRLINGGDFRPQTSSDYLSV